MMLHRQSHSVMSLLALSLLLVCPHASAALEGRQVMEGDIFDSDPYGNNGYQSNDASVDTSDFGRIVGGTDATPMSAYPFYSFVTVTRTDDNGSSGTIGCGGSLIHDDIILTAAHCFLFDVTEVQVFVNRTQYSSLTGFEYFRRTESWQVHPGYNAATYANDVAMIHLTRSVTQVPPLQLNADAAIPADNSDVTVIGLGFISQEGGFPAALQQVTLQTVDSATCIAQNSAQIALEGATQVCAAADGKDSCQGDSGGPLFSTLPDGSFSQVGIVSFGIGCAQPVSDMPCICCYACYVFFGFVFCCFVFQSFKVMAVAFLQANLFAQNRWLLSSFSSRQNIPMLTFSFHVPGKTRCLCSRQCLQGVH